MQRRVNKINMKNLKNPSLFLTGLKVYENLFNLAISRL